MQKEHVILYGFGWVGQSMLAFCEAMGFECRIVDDGINKDFVCDERVVGIEVFREPFALCLIAAHEEALAQKLLVKIHDMGIGEHLVRHISSDAYYPTMSYLLPDFFGSAQNLLELWHSESFTLPRFHAKLAQLVETYHRNKAERNKGFYDFHTQIDSTLPHRSVFAKMFNIAFIKGESPHIHYPGFSVHIELDERADENFYFESFDWDMVRNRSADTKLIACFGSSALRLSYLPLCETLTEFLRKELEAHTTTQYIVLNLGIIGYTIYEQMMLYNALIYPLAPDIVLSFFGDSDWRTGFIDCEVILKEHKIIYSPDYHEYQVKKFIESISLIRLNSLPLLGELEIPNPKISDNDVNLAVAMRLRQFHDVVSGGGGRFAAFIQPFLPCKKVWTKEEELMQHNAKTMNRISPYMNQIIGHIPQLVSSFKQQCLDLDYLFDLNQMINDSPETLFVHEWSHCNARGNALCAQYVAQVLRQKNWL